VLGQTICAPKSFGRSIPALLTADQESLASTAAFDTAAAAHFSQQVAIDHLSTETRDSLYMVLHGPAPAKA